MDKSVLISIQPYWCSQIVNGDKTLEIRKSKPKLPTPFKCYIYCTKGDKYNPLEYHRDDGKIVTLNGKIIGEFICDNIEEISVPYPAYQNELPKRILEESCTTYLYLHRYALISNDCNLFAWHISDLKIYNEPKEMKGRVPQSWKYVEE